MSKVMNVLRGIKSIYVRLGEVDCPDEENIFDDPNYGAELKASSDRLQKMEDKFSSKPATSKNGGKGNSKKSQIVETVVIDPKVVKKSAEMKKEQESKGNER